MSYRFQPPELELALRTLIDGRVQILGIGDGEFVEMYWPDGTPERLEEPPWVIHECEHGDEPNDRAAVSDDPPGLRSWTCPDSS